MRFFSIILIGLLGAGMSGARLLSPVAKQDPMSGWWEQAMSSRYVHETTEIDWDCVKLHLEVEEGSDGNDLVHYNKTADLHDLKNTITSVQRTYRRVVDEDGVISLIPVSVTSTTFPSLVVRSSKNMTDDSGYLILTGTNNLTLYVLTRDYAAFINSLFYQEVLELLQSFDYTSYYKFPLSSYSSACAS